MISAAYALTCLVFCILAVSLTIAKPSDISVEQKVETKNEKAIKNKDNSSQSLTTYYPEPTKIPKKL